MIERVEPSGEDPESAQRPLGDLHSLRVQARARRHAFWLPLLMFGALICASAPMYVESLPSGGPSGGFISPAYAISFGTPHFAALGGLFPTPGNVDPDVRGLYWLLALLLGALVTALWYSWHAAVTGVATGVRGTVAIWVAGALVLTAVSIASFELVFRAWPATNRGTSGLLVVAVGLVALAWVERSWLLAAICVVYTFAACIGVFYNPENQLFPILTDLGVSDQSLPYNDAGTINVLLPGVVLILGGLVAVSVDLRHR